MDIRKLLEAGHEALSAKHAEKERNTLGHPRVGGVGILTPEGTVYGSCQRKTLSRQMGMETEASFSTHIMWKAGESNEGHWERILGLGYKGKILTHDQVGIRQTIPGVPLEVLGHPDIVLADEEGKPLFGIELKGIFGYYTAVSVELEGKPKNDNIIQAATYSYFTKLPYALAYTSACFTKLNFQDAKFYGLKSILPFYRIFYMEWRNDVLFYRDERDEDWTETNITPQAIEDYYRLVAQMKQTKQLGPRPLTNYVNGERDKWGPHGQCGLCEFKSACTNYDSDNDYDRWMESITLLTRKKEVSSD